mmetsp:Transcript_21823/g.19884  ORF Transcript_21823/g.19884 Transcript_21823/m.19884 type:complete len:137 (-) Transcript_21823:20-430(-)
MNLLIILILSLITIVISDKGEYVSRDIEHRINNLDNMTKKRVLAMHAAGIPSKSIAEKISYVTNNDVKKATKLVDGIKYQEQLSKQKSKKQTNKQTNYQSHTQANSKTNSNNRKLNSNNKSNNYKSNVNNQNRKRK